MTVLSDRSLADLYPAYRGAIGPASINLHLADSLLVWPVNVRRDPRIDQSGLWRPAAMHDIGGQVWILRPHLRYLAATAEPIAIPDDMVGQIAARSSWGRDGLSVICGPAGFLDPCFHGNPTLELSVIGSELVIWPGAAVCQLILMRLDRACGRGYMGKYQGDELPTPSRSHLDGRGANA
jgi:deoxycytidine triphosphate deaminase